MSDHDDHGTTPLGGPGQGDPADDARTRRWPPVLRRPGHAVLARIEGRVRAETWRRYGTAGTAPIAPHRRPVRLAVASVAAVLAAGGVAGGAMLMQGGDGAVIVDPPAAPAIRETADLRRAPWLFQPDGSPHIATVARRRSLLFPRGTTYRRAVTRLTLSVITRGRLPAGTRAVAPLPRGVVWQPGTRVRGPRLSLVAPFGYAIPEGSIRPPSYRFRKGIDFNQAAAILRRLRGSSLIGAAGARGLSVDAPRLARCQINPPGRTPVPCRLDPPKAPPRPGN